MARRSLEVLWASHTLCSAKEQKSHRKSSLIKFSSVRQARQVGQNKIPGKSPARYQARKFWCFSCSVRNFSCSRQVPGRTVRQKEPGKCRQKIKKDSSPPCDINIIVFFDFLLKIKCFGRCRRVWVVLHRKASTNLRSRKAQFWLMMSRFVIKVGWI